MLRICPLTSSKPIGSEQSGVEAVALVKLLDRLVQLIIVNSEAVNKISLMFRINIFIERYLAQKMSQ